MKEIEYTRLSNRIAVSHALQLFRSVIPGDKHGITDAEYDDIKSKLRAIEVRLFKSSNKTEKE